MQKKFAWEITDTPNFTDKHSTKMLVGTLQNTLSTSSSHWVEQEQKTNS